MQGFNLASFWGNEPGQHTYTHMHVALAYTYAYAMHIQICIYICAHPVHSILFPHLTSQCTCRTPTADRKCPQDAARNHRKVQRANMEQTRLRNTAPPPPPAPKLRDPSESIISCPVQAPLSTPSASACQPKLCPGWRSASKHELHVHWSW